MFTRKFARSFDDASPRFQLTAAVAEYAEILRESYWANESDLSDVLSIAEDVSEMMRGDRDVEEFVDLADMAEQFDDRLSLNRCQERVSLRSKAVPHIH